MAELDERELVTATFGRPFNPRHVRHVRRHEPGM